MAEFKYTVEHILGKLNTADPFTHQYQVGAGLTALWTKLELGLPLREQFCLAFPLWRPGSCTLTLVLTCSRHFETIHSWLTLLLRSRPCLTAL